MPTYEYECNKCGHEFEAFQSMTSGALKKCPACGKLSLKRLIGTGGVIFFKGSGFYSTDYRPHSRLGWQSPAAVAATCVPSDSATPHPSKHTEGNVGLTLTELGT